MQQRSGTEGSRRPRLEIHKPVFFPAAALILVVVVYGAVFPDNAFAVLSETVLPFVTDYFSWLLVGAIVLFIGFCVWLIAGPYGNVRLGPSDSRPDYSYLSWFAMLFSAGMGIGLVFYGVAEPMWHFMDPPRAAEPGSIAAAEDALVWSFHHWGLGPWAVYSVLGLSLAYFGFRHNLPLTVRSALYPLIGDRIHGPIGNAVDVLAIVATLMGVAVSLGLGAMQINAGLESVFGVASSTEMQIGLIVLITIAATVSVVAGLDRGIRRLSQLNLVLAAALLIFVALAGPTVVLISAYVDNVGNYVQNFFQTLFTAGAYTDQDAEGFLGDWTLFYWSWWISWSPFVGMFIARISRGRTVREFVSGVLFVPAVIGFVWFTVMGNTGIEFQDAGIADIWGAIDPDQGGADEAAMFTMLESMPFATIVSVITIVLITVFFVTSSDSGSFVVDILSSGGNPNPPVATRVFWALSEGALAAALLWAGGELALDAIEAGAVSTGLPFSLILLVVVAGLIKGLRSERSEYSLTEIVEGADPYDRPKRSPDETEHAAALNADASEQKRNQETGRE